MDSLIRPELDHQLILPDSRAKVLRGSIEINGVWHEQTFCANCGRKGGLVPEDNMTFVFWLCNPCYAKHGEIANTMAIPDEVFFESVKREQLDTFGRELTLEELIAVADADASPLATLLLSRA